MTDITLDAAGTRRRMRSPLEWLVTRVGRRMIPLELSGRLRVTLPSGNEILVNGKARGPEGELSINRWVVLGRAMLSGGNGFAESYVRGEVDSPDLVNLIKFFAANRAGFLAAGKRLFSSRTIDRWRHLRRANTPAGSRRNIAAHYDLSNDFFRTWLDDGMTYSSALFNETHDTLATAQQNKYDRIIEALALRPGAEVLEIGCGWGGLAARLLISGDCHYTGITLSREQLAYARSRPETTGFADRANFHFRDYRDTTGQYDAIASIEMLEAVGEENWPVYFATLRDRLKPGGTAVIQSIVIAPDVFERYRRKADFIQTYIFPGGMLPTIDIVQREARAARLTVHRLQTFGHDYGRTLRLWREAFEARWDEIARLGFDERFRRLWRYYLAYCEAGFTEGVVDVALFKLERPGDGPCCSALN